MKLSQRFGAVLTLLFGGALVLAPIVGQVRHMLGMDVPQGDATITRVAAAAEGVPDRVQFVVCVLDDGNVAAPAALHERIIPVYALLQGQATVPFPGARGAGTLSLMEGAGAVPATDEELLRRLVLQMHLREWVFASSTAIVHGLGALSLDLGDGRAWVKGPAAFAMGAPRLRHGLRRTFLSLVRPLHPGDVLEPAPAAAWCEELGRALRAGEAPAMFGLRDTLPVSPLARVLLEGHEIGMLVFACGLLLLLYARLGWVRAGAVTLAVAVCLLSLAARFDLRSQRERLAAEDADERVAAALHLAHSQAFAPTAAEALHAAFASEPDPQVRAAFIAACGAAPIRALEPVQRMLAQAAADPEEAVRRAASHVRAPR